MTTSRLINSLMRQGISEGEAASFPNGNGAGVTLRTSVRAAPRVRNESFPPTMPLGQFLFEYLYRRGVHHGFGIPGDFALPTFAWLEKSKIQNITMTHEPAAGFAADAYSRINGIGLVCVTYCVGGLNVLNAIAGALRREIAGCRCERCARKERSRKRSAPASQGQNFRNAAPHLRRSHRCEHGSAR